MTEAVEYLEIEDGMIEDRSPKVRDDPSKPHTYYLFVTRVTTYQTKSGKEVTRRKKDVVTIHGDTRDEADQKILKLCEQPGNVVMPPKKEAA